MSETHAGRIALAAILVVAGHLVTVAASSVPAEPTGPSGVDLMAHDRGVRPGDDFCRYALGTWYATTPIPPDQAEVGADSDVSARVREQLRNLIDHSTKSPTPAGAQIGALYSSFMDEERVESLDATPMQADLALIVRATNKDEFLALMASATTNFGSSLFSLQIEPDAKSSENVLYVGQAGLGLDDPDSYLSSGSASQQDAYRNLHRRYLKISGLFGTRSQRRSHSPIRNRNRQSQLVANQAPRHCRHL
jgi:putative endopeptidase